MLIYYCLCDIQGTLKPVAQGRDPRCLGLSGNAYSSWACIIIYMTILGCF